MSAVLNLSPAAAAPKMRLAEESREWRLTSESWAERRVFPRQEVRMEVQGRRLDHSLAALQDPRLQLHLRDLSVGGLSAMSERPVNEGEHLSVICPPRNGKQAWNAFGRVIRCEPSSMGYRVAMEFDSLPAA
jgi:hypothetical protein